MSDADLFAWARGYEERLALPGPYPNIHRVRFRLRHLADRTFIKRRLAAAFLAESGLVELTWYMVWHDVPNAPAEVLPQRLAEAEGFVIFLHGWDGTHAIWEDMAEAVVAGNPRLIAFVFDHNGFGGTPFVDETPAIATCNPPAAMRVIERWINLMHLRGLADRPARVINFVGHSMGGASLFYLDAPMWRPHEQTRYPLAPALLLEDDLHQAFYQVLGLGIGVLNRLPELGLLNRLDDLLTPAFVEILAGGASASVKEIHEIVYKTTPKGVMARTLVAMGKLDQEPPAWNWQDFRVALGERDSLVGLAPMQRLLHKLAVPPEQVRVLPGDHYFFSVGENTRATHGPNRQIVIQDILDLHHSAFEQLRS
jgi:hypothetical protein